MSEVVGSSNVKLTEEQLKEVNGKMLQNEDVADAVLYVLSTPPSVQVRNITYR